MLYYHGHHRYKNYSQLIVMTLTMLLTYHEDRGEEEEAGDEEWLLDVVQSEADYGQRVRLVPWGVWGVPRDTSRHNTQ